LKEIGRERGVGRERQRGRTYLRFLDQAFLVVLQVSSKPVRQPSQADRDEEIDGKAGGARVMLGEETSESLGEGGREGGREGGKATGKQGGGGREGGSNGELIFPK